MSNELLVLTCPPRVVVLLVEELLTQLEANHSVAKVVKYGVLSKGSDGFVVIACPYPDGFPTLFLESIHHDEEITGYVLISCDNPIETEAQA